MTIQGRRIRKDVLGGYLQRQRARLGLKQDEVAAAAGIDRSLYNAYENSRRGMAVEKVPAMARALNVPESEILALADQAGVVAELAVQIADLRTRVERLESA